MKKSSQDKLGVDKPQEAKHQEQNYTSRSAPGKTMDKPNPEPEPYHKTLHDGEGYQGNPGKTPGKEATAQDVKQDLTSEGQMLRQMQQGKVIDSGDANAENDSPTP